MQSIFYKRFLKASVLTTLFVAFAAVKVFAEGPPKPSQLDNPLAVSLIIVAGALLLAIVMLGRVLINVAELKMEREKEQKKIAAAATKAVVVLIFCSLGITSFAQEATEATSVAKETAASFGGLSAFSFYAIVSIIVLEVIVIAAMLISLKSLIAKEKVAVAEVAEEKQVKENVLIKIWSKLNNFRPAHEEVVLGHDYDGIRELDNRLPPWWLYGFYACIVFACVYLYRAHVSHTSPSSEQEYIAAVAKAEADKEAYLKKAANKVDENSVVLLTDADQLAEGKKIFASVCAACHGPEGQGIVGPNLTDDYWLHKGGIKDIFKTIKYGVPEKGMKAWESDFSPMQLAELASYIKSLRGTKPANPKEPQGEIYTEETLTTTSDSSSVVAEAK